ncbi:lysophospholipid acyltransferase family protein [Methylomonas sp. EFPC1]|uniref:L-ornithine N(alpha)-acyltransferase n=1 Tax=Methylomonas defluvii TaxID=3045149 RepID=A0ABU4UI46_9GAMM|nr:MULTISPECIES: lysophospholipid acyltransferase family protein [unclassified Methylomonas]MDX8129140.1 lysophospholipid acyltransferase family protein [Methylomonas sp. OY6]QSA99750.1 lysophospholipid acyltransferase family protein [Methylomonas sp. EFPC1]
MIDAERILQETYPDFKFGKDNKLVVQALKKLIHEDDFNDVIRKNQHLRGFAFLDKLLNYFKFNYQVSNDCYNNIPSEGRLLIVANHPIGTLDGLALVKLIRSVRPDVRIVANRVLSHMEPLQSIFLPVDVLSDKKKLKDVYKVMLDALEHEEAIIFFPAGEVSRITPKGIRDGAWQSGFIKLARRAQCPILPIFIKAKNSALFYSASTLYKPLGTMLLVKEMFNKKGQEIKFMVGAPVPYQVIADSEESNKQLSQRFRKHVQNLGKKNKPALFETVATVVHPSDTKAVKKALYQSRLLGETRDGKKIFLYQFQDDCPVMREIARLRELTFRTVEEGTGLALDLDKFDIYYSHIVLWDDNDLEIVGAYRVGEGSAIMASHGVDGFYTQTLFDLRSEFETYLPYSIELGRSFVQPRYWGQHSLDYLWYGIGAYLRERPDIKYLFGPVSISNAYPQAAKELIIGFYQQQFASDLQHTKARTPFVISQQGKAFAATEFSADYSTSFKILNSELKKLGVKVPTLYKQYVELCVDKGCHFVAFNIDPDFNNCIDGLIMVEVDKIAPKKRQRYIEKSLAG